jgi:integrase
VWHPVDSSYEQINFKRYFPNKNHYPLELFCRIVCYELIQNNGFAANTIFNQMIGLRKLVNSAAWGEVMLAERNQSFPFFSALEPNSLTNFAQTHLAKGLDLAHVGFNFLNRLSSVKHSPGLDVMLAGMNLPWKDEGIGYRKWIDQQKEIAGVAHESGFYAPLPFQNVSNIVQHALPIVLEHHEVLISFFDEFNNLDNCRNFPSLKSKKRSQAALRVVEKYKDTFNIILPIQYQKYEDESNETVSNKWFTQLLKLVQSACAWIVLLTTGLRNIDMRNLVVGCCKPSKRMENMWWLVSDIKKTKNRIIIPVGEPTYKASKLLESARYFHSDFLIVSSRNSTHSGSSGREYTDEEIGLIRTTGTFNALLKVLPKRRGFSIQTIFDDADATAHCVRATLAGYIAENSHLAILILKRLFGHSNALMPDEYIRRNPLVIKKRQELQLKLTDSMAQDMAYAVAHGQVSGRNGEALLKGAENIKSEIGREARLENRSLTEMELFQTLEERLTRIFFDDMINDETYALLTPMAVICNRACNNTSDSPCAAHSNNQKRVSAGVKKAITDALSTLPNPAQCVGIACADALIGKKWSRPLLETFDYFHKYRQATSENTCIEEDATVFLNTYAAPLMAIYGDEREEGYFNVTSCK